MGGVLVIVDVAIQCSADWELLTYRLQRKSGALGGGCVRRLHGQRQFAPAAISMPTNVHVEPAERTADMMNQICNTAGSAVSREQAHWLVAMFWSREWGNIPRHLLAQYKLCSPLYNFRWQHFPSRLHTSNAGLDGLIELHAMQDRRRRQQMTILAVCVSAGQRMYKHDSPLREACMGVKYTHLWRHSGHLPCKDESDVKPPAHPLSLLSIAEPDFCDTTQQWRAFCEKQGLKGPHLCSGRYRKTSPVQSASG